MVCVKFLVLFRQKLDLKEKRENSCEFNFSADISTPSLNIFNKKIRH